MWLRPDIGSYVGSGIEHEERFRRVYEGAFESLLAYALRRVEQPADAADVVAETFLVAWRRGRQMPDGAEATLWLYGVARRVLANHYRGGVRRERLGERLRQRLGGGGHGPGLGEGGDPGHEVSERLTVQGALARLAELDREVLLLTFWEGLEPREAAVVLGVSPVAARARLSRACARFRELMNSADQIAALRTSEREK
jgi:RNA polymerase sigma factor (sigma-70 family)